MPAEVARPDEKMGLGMVEVWFNNKNTKGYLKKRRMA